MNDNLNFLLENGYTVADIEREQKHNGFTIDQMAEAARKIISRGAALVETPAPNDKSQTKQDRKPRLCLELLDAWLSERNYAIRLNVMTREVEITGISNEFNPETMGDDLPIILYDALKYEYQCSKDIVADLLKLIAGRHRYNPVLDMLNSVTWDGVDRISEVFDILGIQDGDKLSRTLIWKWLCQCVALAGNEYNSAFGADGMLVLQGPQGIGKTSFVRALGVLPELVKLGQYIDTKDKDTTRRCTSAWIVELGEVETTLRSDLERLKAFITAERDEYRLPYGRADQKLVRSTSLIATCNSERFLIDPTGSRRFWTVPVDRIDLDALGNLDSLQLWAEIKKIVDRDRQCFRLTQEEHKMLAERNAAHEKPIKAQIEVEDILSEATSKPAAYIWRDDTVSAFKEGYDSLRNYSAEQIGRALDKVGLAAQKKKVGGVVKRVRNLPFKNYGSYSVVGCG